MTLIMGIVFLVTLLFGVPIAFVVGIASLVTIIIQGVIPLNAIPQYMFIGLDSFPLLAIPFFHSGRGTDGEIWNLKKPD